MSRFSIHCTPLTSLILTPPIIQKITMYIGICSYSLKHFRIDLCMLTLYYFVSISSALNKYINLTSFRVLLFSRGYRLDPLWWQEVFGSLDLGFSSAVLPPVSCRSFTWLRCVQYYWKGGYKGKANTTYSSDGKQWRGQGLGEEEMLLQSHYDVVRELYRSKNYFLVVGGPGE